jgi:L-alanine-DL-glutamate epimerase-like enolase superfamily enzyme
MDRRKFVLKSAAGTLGLFALGTGEPFRSAAMTALPDLTITKIDIVRFSPGLRVAGAGVQWMWLRLHTSEGIIGTGETYPFNEASASAIKDLQWHSWAGKLIGTNPLEIEQTWERIYRQNAFHVSGGAEMRALSAINIAQWDIMGQATKMPLYQLLGGSRKKNIRVYNTYTDSRNINGWMLEKDMEKIASFLVEQGITAIKFCPFDIAASRNNGEIISKKEIDQCITWIKRVRDAVGYDLEMGCEFHSMWNLPSAVRIAKALEPHDILFLEDIMLPDNMQAYVTLQQETSIPLVISERLATRFAFREMLESKGRRC